MIQRFNQVNPRGVEALQWDPDSKPAVAEMVNWLLMRHAEFKITYSSPDDPPAYPGRPLLVVDDRGNTSDSFVFPGDWLVSEGHGAWACWSDASFRANYELVD